MNGIGFTVHFELLKREPTLLCKSGNTEIWFQGITYLKVLQGNLQRTSHQKDLAKSLEYLTEKLDTFKPLQFMQPQGKQN